ncbi:MAG: F0F1 ATP synthase subunit epsilon [Sediminibacterium sp.]|nr:F0F1 ATP synthase subunit epsilon [Sediminibacterium sp.]
MLVKILTPELTLLQQEIVGILLPATTGKLEILNNHAPLIASLTSGEVKVFLNEQHTKKFQIQGGVVQVLKNEVIVLAEGGQSIEE